MTMPSPLSDTSGDPIGRETLLVPSSTIVAGAAAGTATQAAADITNAVVPANTVFTGTVALSASASQAAAVNAAGTLKVQVSWVPGAGGTAAQVVASLDLDFSANGAATAGQALAESIDVPVELYAGTTSGKFQVASIATGTISHQTWDVAISGNAQ